MLKLTKDDKKNLQALLARVTYQGLGEAKLAVVLDAKLQAEIDSPEDTNSSGNNDGSGVDKSGADKPKGD